MQNDREIKATYSTVHICRRCRVLRSRLAVVCRRRRRVPTTSSSTSSSSSSSTSSSSSWVVVVDIVDVVGRPPGRRRHRRARHQDQAGLTVTSSCEQLGCEICGDERWKERGHQLWGWKGRRDGRREVTPFPHQLWGREAERKEMRREVREEGDEERGQRGRR